ncbi:hypothetical protein [Massilimicrobiota timonensis]|uniref:hypothetical protein n=1 Tax=Massilimicrobiota timonensis TaxID=1776392 RepID=UPI0036F3B94B
MLFNNCISGVLSIFNYSDEIITIILVLLTVYKAIKNKNNLLKLFSKNSNEFKSIIFFLIFIIIGIISTIFLEYDIQIIPIIKDIFAFSKFFICYYCSLIVFNKEINATYLIKFSKIVIFILFFLSIISQFIDIGMTHDVRMGIKSFKFLFVHPTFLVFTMVMLFCLVHLYKYSLKYELMIFFIIFMTQRTKGLLFVVGVLALIFILKYFKKIKIKHIVVLGGLVLLLSFNKIMTYISAAQFSARPLLYITAFQIMFNYFPLGTGFSSFGTYTSAEYYSPLYYKYNLFYIEGLRPTSFGYIGDTFWPGLIGQFGAFGCISYITSLFYIFRSSIENITNNSRKYESIIYFWLYIILALFVETTLTNESGVFVAIFLVLIKKLKNS